MEKTVHTMFAIIIRGSLILMAFEKINLAFLYNQFEIDSYLARTWLFESVIPLYFEQNRFEHELNLS